ncbi:GCN5 family acetyltransferase [Thermoplasmatales archaeon SG8-52-2]|nr:MAG: GCN5 family acetyltransferase [Thermoplasmatales archaeon SG8-52-2]
MLTIRTASIKDIDEITNIYNEAIKKTVATFDTEEKTIAERKKWFKEHGKNNPLIVAEEENIILGWAALSKYSTRCAYSDTAEISLYVKEEYQNKGIGKRLLEKIIKEGKQAGLHVIIARITEGNKKSIYLHKSVGFEHVGIMKEVGRKFGKILDVYLMQKIYK